MKESECSCPTNYIYNTKTMKCQCPENLPYDTGMKCVSCLAPNTWNITEKKCI